MKHFRITPIGIIHTPFKRMDECPHQGRERGAEGEVILDERLLPALKNLEGVTHLFLLTFFHLADRHRLQTVTPHGPEIRGTFATRSPHRPNPIGLTVVEILKINGYRLHVRGVDCLDGTPIIDIKPYVTDIDLFPQAVTGWVKKSKNKGRGMPKSILY